LKVHLDAFMLNPQAYLTATKWRLLRKRVRATGQFASLLAQSTKAYELWALIDQRNTCKNDFQDKVGIVALISATGDGAALQTTLSSLASAGIPSFVLSHKGEPSAADNTLQDLAHEIDWAQASWLMPLAAGDRVSRNAAGAYMDRIAECDPECRIIYADDDILDRWGHRSAPYFKPDWNAELQRHHDILTGACIVRAAPADLEAVLGHPDWPSRLVASAADGGSVDHIQRVLHHRAARIAPPIRLRPVSIASPLPLVSVIIPTRNRADLLRTCIEGLNKTRYPAIEIIIADNESDEPSTQDYLVELTRRGVVVLPQPGLFNYSMINNNAVAIANGDLICLMNNDIEVLSLDWLEVMATQALRPEVGAVGAQLLYPEGGIQHAGVVVGVGNAAGHAHRHVRPESVGYFRRHALPQYVSAVTAACLVVQRERFLAVGGLDEDNFAVAFNDVDLCMKLNQRGWQSFYEPRAMLVHHESVSRGFDTDPVGAARFAKELAALQRIWRTNEIVDPYHHPMLSRASEQFALDLTSTMVRS
jgi:GT2 family glycosyltransferase